jgi:hypothetical protein
MRQKNTNEVIMKHQKGKRASDSKDFIGSRKMR